MLRDSIEFSGSPSDGTVPRIDAFSLLKRRFLRTSNAFLVDHFIAWMDRERYTKGTQRRNKKVICEFCSFLFDKRLKAVTPVDIYEFLTTNAKTSTSQTRYRSYLISLRCFFRYLYLSGAVET